MVFPGVSSTIILMCLGVYGLYLEAVSSVNLILLVPMGLGLVIEEEAKQYFNGNIYVPDDLMFHHLKIQFFFHFLILF